MLRYIIAFGLILYLYPTLNPDHLVGAETLTIVEHIGFMLGFIAACSYLTWIAIHDLLDG
jgi:hypothetical protein